MCLTLSSLSRRLIAMLALGVAVGLTTPVFANCVWQGTAPFCNGTCGAGFAVANTDKDGCAAGTKVLCCTVGPLGIGMPPEWCNGYGNSAISQVDSATKANCGFSGPRWTPDKEAHRRWCLSLNGNQTPAYNEYEARWAGLRQCTQFCQDYANKAIQQVQLALDLKCGFTGARWVDETEDHLIWCQYKGGKPYANGETAAREAALQGCKQNQPMKHDCKDLGPNEEAAGGSSNPKEKYECENLGGGKKRCCWVTYP